MTAPNAPTVHAPASELPVLTRLEIFLRLLAIQGSWNYEILLGNGIGFCVEPALRRLPGGPEGPAYRAALARQCHYFNAHPYLASVAVGALARAELDGESPHRIDRFRTALCGPLGSVGDRLVWAGWLPLCSLLALAAFGLGGGPFLVLLIFVGIYNAGHLMLRAWGLAVGWEHGMHVSKGLANPVLRSGPAHIARLAAFVAGVALPIALGRIIGPGRTLLGEVLVGVALGALLVFKLQGRAEGWRIALLVLAAVVLFAVIR